jgi:ubiquinone/menaquinone biosynthesis C-methylase UbiE
MPIDFHAEKNRFSYTTREADPTWVATFQELVEVKGKQVLDIGCGGGIYSKAIADLGAASVTGADFSEEMLKGAQENCREYPQVRFAVGDAYDTGLPSGQFDVILERALIHHLQDLQACFAEAYRLLQPGGTLVVQDRTPEDCLLPGSETHVRGYFFERYPKLSDKETGRRPQSAAVVQAMRAAGFADVAVQQAWETRRTYANEAALAEDLLARTGRSILHELNDAELQDMVQFIQAKLQAREGQAIVEQDRWTIWVAKKGE